MSRTSADGSGGEIIRILKCVHGIFSNDSELKIEWLLPSVNIPRVLFLVTLPCNKGNTYLCMANYTSEIEMQRYPSFVWLQPWTGGSSPKIVLCRDVINKIVCLLVKSKMIFGCDNNALWDIRGGWAYRRFFKWLVNGNDRYICVMLSDFIFKKCKKI